MLLGPEESKLLRKGDNDQEQPEIILKRQSPARQQKLERVFQNVQN